MLQDTNGKVLARRVVRFRNAFSQALGLRFRKAAPDTLYVFDFGRRVRHRFSMWFVFSPIDLYFLDEKLRVVNQKLGFQPFTSYRPRSKYRYAVETRSGLLADPSRLRRLLKRKL